MYGRLQSPSKTRDGIDTKRVDVALIEIEATSVFDPSCAINLLCILEKFWIIVYLEGYEYLEWFRCILNVLDVFWLMGIGGI